MKKQLSIIAYHAADNIYISQRCKPSELHKWEAAFDMDGWVIQEVTEVETSPLFTTLRKALEV